MSSLVSSRDSVSSSFSGSTSSESMHLAETGSSIREEMPEMSPVLSLGRSRERMTQRKACSTPLDWFSRI